MTGPGIYQATNGKELGVLIPNISSRPVYLTGGQAVEKAAEHPVALM